MHYVIGIDEAGRGPWAGPIMAGGFMIREDMIEQINISLPGLMDSKMLSASKREGIFNTIEYMQSIGECQYSFAYRESEVIDTVGIRETNRQCMQDVIISFLSCLGEADTVHIYIDGCDNFIFESIEAIYCFAQKRRKISEQKHTPQDSQSSESTSLHAINIPHGSGGRITISYIIGGDSIISIISAASIIAKVIRDRMMCDFSVEYPEYGFELHKGYGTRKHRDAIINYGITPMHRKSYKPVKSLILQATYI